MTVAYATEAELAAFLSDGTTVVDASRLLARASELLDERITAPFDVDADTALPTDTTVASALSGACCAQVEFWLEVGEEHDVSGLANRGAAVGHLRLDSLPPELAPRARRILSSVGLTSASAITTGRGDRYFAGTVT